MVKRLYTIDEVHSLMDYKSFTKEGSPKSYITLDGDDIKISSKRIDNFRVSTTCMYCGLEASGYTKDIDTHDTAFHINLRGLKNGRDIIMTKGFKAEGTTCKHCLDKMNSARQLNIQKPKQHFSLEYLSKMVDSCNLISNEISGFKNEVVKLTLSHLARSVENDYNITWLDWLELYDKLDLSYINNNK